MLPSIVSVPEPVIVIPLMLVAVAAPKLGVVKLGLVVIATLPVPLMA
jgi:hypothetical protein